MALVPTSYGCVKILNILTQSYDVSTQGCPPSPLPSLSSASIARGCDGLCNHVVELRVLGISGTCSSTTRVPRGLRVEEPQVMG
jgi:hypothetical protein